MLKSLPIEEGSINLAVLDPSVDFWQAVVSLRLDRIQLHDLNMVAKVANENSKHGHLGMRTRPRINQIPIPRGVRHG